MEVKSKSDWNTYKTSMLKIQKFILGSGFIGSIKAFKFYHGSYIYTRTSEKSLTNQVPHCRLGLNPYPYIIPNNTIKAILTIPTNECIICNLGNSNGTNGCNSKSSCGKGFLDFSNVTQSCDICGDYCRNSKCHDNIRGGLEICDDGQNGSISGCTDDCMGIKKGYACTGKFESNHMVDSCKSVCGDGIKTDTEECDVNSEGCVSCKLKDGYYCLDQTCKICKENCQKCSNMTHCNVCSSGNYKDVQGSCQRNCGDQFYGDNSTGSCKFCADSNCLKCNDNQCQQCKNNFFLIDNVCVISCPSNNFPSNGQCFKCWNKDCDVCANQSSNGCKKCANGYLYKGTCSSKCFGKQYTNDNDKICEDCTSHCNSCNKTSCMQCESPYFLKSGKCETFCGNGYVGINSVCKSCSEIFPGYKCITCDTNGCTSCEQNNFVTEDFRCGTCGEGFFADNQTNNCESCSENCQKCVGLDVVGSVLVSLSTASGSLAKISKTVSEAVVLAAVRSKCTQCSVDFYLNHNSSCFTSCEAGYYANATSNICEKCQVLNCLDCSSDVTNCTKCNLTTRYINPISKQCLADIPMGFFLLSSLSMIVMPCNSSCNECSGPVTCKSCKSGYLNENNYCIESCENGYFENKITTKCDKCNASNCDKCDSSLIKCVLCSNNYFYENQTIHSCILKKCGDNNYYYNTLARTCTRCKDPNCLTCSLSVDKCDICGINYYLNSSLQCVTKCDQGFGVVQNSATVNMNPFSSVPISIKECKNCNDNNCKECYSNSSICSYCEDSYYLLKGTCVKRENYKAGYYLTDESPPQLKTCKDSFCGECNDGDSCCTVCIHGYRLNGCECSAECPDGKYKNKDNDCDYCTLNCDKCALNPAQNDTLVCSKCSSTSFKFNWTEGCGSCPPNLDSTIGNVILNAYFKNSVNGVDYCGICPTNCNSCESFENCSSCFNNHYLFEIRGKVSCEGECPNGTYLDKSEGKCKFCSVENCVKCSQKDQCSECKNYLLDNVCVDNCPSSGYYSYLKDNSISICKSCETEYCKSCSSDGSLCNECAEIMFLLDGKCMESCSEGNYPNGKKCEKCMDSCIKCSSSNNCDSCDSTKKKYRFKSNELFTCQSLSSGMYVNLETFTIEKCMSNCLECTSNSTCKTPEKGYVFYEKTGQIYKNKCPDGSYACTDKKNCLTCSNNCLLCSSLELCSACKEGFVLDNSKKCTNKCPEQFSNYSGICYQCPNNSVSCIFEKNSNGKIIAQAISQCKPGFYLQAKLTCVKDCPAQYYKSDSSMTCSNCLENCETCINQTICSNCIANFFLIPNQKACISKKECDSYVGWFSNEESSICKECTLSNCHDCLDLENCKTCEEGFLLYNSHCEKKCPDGFFNDSNRCTPCKITGCKDCSTNSSLCDKCLLKNVLSEDQTMCVSQCENGFVADSNGEKCIKCGLNCDQCANELYNFTCIVPSKNFFLLPPSLIGISECPESYFSDENRICYSCSCQCLRCSNLNTCSKCNVSSEYYLDQRKSECVSANNIDSGYYIDKDSGYIVKCNILNCKTCLSSTECDFCDENYFWDPNSQVCSTQCSKGSGKKMAKNKQNKCENCQIEKCQICDTSQRICDVCVNGYMLVDGKFTCERQCPNGYYKAKKNSCFQCAEGCHTCSNSINCQICESNFYFFEGKCIKFLNPNNKTIEDYIERCDICLVENYPCPEKTYKNESEFACHRCDQSCIQCKNGAECMECGPNRTLEDGFCYKICPNFTYLNKSSNQCFKCQNFCKICEDFKNCLQCDDHFYLNMNGTCLLGEGYYISMLESENEKSSSFATNVPEIVILEPMEEINDEQLIDLNELEVIEEDTSASESSSSTSDSTSDSTSSSNASSKAISYTSSNSGPISNEKLIIANLTPTYVIIACHGGCKKCDSNLVCSICNENYTLIQSTNECLQPCESGLYRDISSKTCMNCTYPCNTCNSIDNCSSCATDFKVNESSMCVANFTCGNSKYLNGYECSDCIANCEKCENNHNCHFCEAGFEKVNETVCKNCSEIFGLGSDCNEKCGDGYLFNSETSGHQCDDGNNLNGDGCDQNCLIESYYTCSRTNSYTPDVCHDTRPFNLTIVLSKQEPQTVVIKPFPSTRKLKPQSDESLKSMINFTIPQLNASIYNFTVTYENNSNLINININYYQTVQNVEMLLILMKSSSRILSENVNQGGLCDEFGIAVSEKYYHDAFNESLYPYKAYSTETIEISKTILKSEQPVSLAFIVSTGPLYIFQAFSLFWLMVDCIQISYFLQFINFDYPVNLDSFLKILANANLNFLPNPFESEKIEVLTHELENQEAPRRFQELGINSSFLKNAGAQMLLFFIAFVLFFGAIFGDWYLTKNRIEGKTAIYTKKIRGAFEYSGMLRIFLMVYLQLCLGSMLQVRHPDISNDFNGFSSFLGSVCFLILIAMFIALFKIINSKTFEEDQNKKKFSILYEDYNKETKMQKNYPSINILKKFLIVFVLVMLHDYPKIAILLLIIIFFSSFIVLIISKPFERKLTNAVMCVTEIAFVVIYFLIGYLIILADSVKNDIIVEFSILERQVNFSWAIVWILCGVFSLYFVIYMRQQILGLKSLFIFLKDFKVKYNEYLQNILSKDKKKRLGIIGSFISDGSIKPSPESEIEKDPTSSIDLDSIDEKYLDLENMPETSFSKFYKKFKSMRNTTNSTEGNEENEENEEKVEKVADPLNLGSPNTEDRKKTIRNIVRKIREKKNLHMKNNNTEN